MSDVGPQRARHSWLERLRRSLLAQDRAAPGPESAGATPLDRQMMARAIELAAAAAATGEVPVGALVYETATGRVLGEGANSRERDSDPTAHAELIAIRAAAAALGDWRLNACTLVVTLEPCAMCAGLAVNGRVGRVVYGAGDPKAGACRTLFHIADDPRLNHRCEIVGGVCAEECGRLLSDFFGARRGPKRLGAEP